MLFDESVLVSLLIDEECLACDLDPSAIKVTKALSQAANDFERSVTQSFKDWLCLNWGQLNLNFKPISSAKTADDVVSTIELFYGNIGYLFFVEMQNSGQGLLKELWQSLFCNKESFDCLFGFVFAKTEQYSEKLSEAVHYAINGKMASKKPISGVFPCKTHNLGYN
jgi:hypothetical protein